MSKSATKSKNGMANSCGSGGEPTGLLSKRSRVFSDSDSDAGPDNIKQKSSSKRAKTSGLDNKSSDKNNLRKNKITSASSNKKTKKKVSDKATTPSSNPAAAKNKSKVGDPNGSKTLDPEVALHYAEFHKNIDWEREVEKQEVAELKAIRDEPPPGCANVFFLMAQWLDVFDILRLRCVSKEFVNIRVDQSALKKALMRKIARFVDMWPSRSFFDLDPKMQRQIEYLCPDGGTEKSHYFQRKFDRQGTLYVKGVTLYRAEESLKLKWMQSHLFDRCDWNPDVQKDVFVNLRRLWNFVGDKVHPGENQCCPNRPWKVNFVHPKRWEEFASFSKCNWRVKFMALFYHHHTDDSPNKIKERLRNLIFRELGRDTEALAILLNPLFT